MLKRLLQIFRPSRPWTAPRAIDFKIRGTGFRGFAGSQKDYLRIRSANESEPDTLDWIEEFVQPGDVFFDIGANVGIYSLYAASRGAKVYAFEPESQNFARLNQNIVANALPIHAYPIAFSDVSGLQQIYLHSFMSGGALHNVGEPVDHEGKRFTPKHVQGIACMTLDGIAGLPSPQHIKLDVDGIETRILNGGRTVLKSVRSLLVELNTREALPEQVLHEAGLRLVSSRRRSAMSENRVYARA